MRWGRSKCKQNLLFHRRWKQIWIHKGIQSWSELGDQNKSIYNKHKEMISVVTTLQAESSETASLALTGDELRDWLLGCDTGFTDDNCGQNRTGRKIKSEFCGRGRTGKELTGWHQHKLGLERALEQTHGLERALERTHGLERALERTHGPEQVLKRSHGLERALERTHGLERGLEHLRDDSYCVLQTQSHSASQGLYYPS